MMSTELQVELIHWSWKRLLMYYGKNKNMGNVQCLKCRANFFVRWNWFYGDISDFGFAKSIKSICANREPVDEIFVYQFIVSSILLLAKLAQIGAHDGPDSKGLPCLVPVAGCQLVAMHKSRLNKWLSGQRAASARPNVSTKVFTGWELSGRATADLSELWAQQRSWWWAGEWETRRHRQLGEGGGHRLHGRDKEVLHDVSVPVYCSELTVDVLNSCNIKTLSIRKYINLWITINILTIQCTFFM